MATPPFTNHPLGAAPGPGGIAPSNVTVTSTSSSLPPWQQWALQQQQMMNIPGSVFPYAPPPVPEPVRIDHKFEPGWRCVLWVRNDVTDETSVKCVPILGIYNNGQGRMYYVLAGASPYVMYDDTQHVQVLSPVDSYDEAEYQPRAEAAYRRWHASQVAKRLTQGAKP